jgi:hypothetical protein
MVHDETLAVLWNEYVMRQRMPSKEENMEKKEHKELFFRTNLPVLIGWRCHLYFLLVQFIII